MNRAESEHPPLDDKRGCLGCLGPKTLIVGLLVGITVLGAGGGFAYVLADRERLIRQQIVQRFTDGGAKARTEPSGPQWLLDRAGPWYRDLYQALVRLDYAHPHDGRPDGQDWVQLGLEHELRWLSLPDHTTDAQLAHLVNCRNIQWLSVPSKKLTDEGIAALGGMSQMRHLNLRDTAITAEGLAALHAMEHLESLDLSGCKLNDAFVEPLLHHRALRWLKLGPGMGPEAIKQLEGLGQLTEMEVASDRLTELDLRYLRRRLPGLVIVVVKNQP